MQYIEINIMPIRYLKCDGKTPTIPVYREYGATTCFKGSGNLLFVGGSHFLVTAAHCADFGGDGDGQWLHVAGGDDVFAIKRKVLTTRLADGIQRNHDPVDFSAVKLLDEEVALLSQRCSFIPEQIMETHRSPKLSPLLSLVGYPADDNRAEDFLCTVSANALNIPVFVNCAYEDNRMRVHPNWYVCLSYDPLNLPVVHDQNLVFPEKLHGMSGGAVWRDNCDLWPPTFAGMMIEHDDTHKAVIALSSSAMLDLLRAWWIPLHEPQ